MAWIETHQSLITHRKTGRLMRALDLSRPTAIGHLQCFWLWCLDNAPEGDLTGVDIEDIADGAYWEGDPQAFFQALITAGFVEYIGDTPCVHDWHDYAGRLVEQRKANAERMRAKRATHVQRTTDARTPATVPNHTIPITPLPPTEPDTATEPSAPPAKQQTSAPKPGTGFDFPGLWAAVETRLGYKPTWAYDRETRTIKRLLGSYPAATPGDFARFLAYLGTAWPFCNEPERQPTFTEGATHFGKWFTGGQPERAVTTPPKNGATGHSPATVSGFNPVWADIKARQAGRTPRQEDS